MTSQTYPVDSVSAANTDAPKAEELTVSFPVEMPKVVAVTGRRANSRMVRVRTPVNVVVTACGHKLDPIREPEHVNCFECWDTFFKLQPGTMMASRSIYKVFGKEGLSKTRGKKFAKFFVRHLERHTKKEEPCTEAPTNPTSE